MSTLMAVLGLALVGLVVWDLLVTVFSASGAGILTRGWTRLTWAALLVLHRRRPVHRLMALAGPAMILVGIVIWYALLGLGAFLVFASQPGAVVLSSDRTPTDRSEAGYFVGVTLSGLGYGDLVPSGFPWTTASSVTTLLGTIVLTASLSYILSVLGAAVQRKSFSSGVRALGDSPAEIVETSALHDSDASLKPYVGTLCTQMSDIAAKHLAYPVVRHFHAGTVDHSPARGVLLLSDAEFLLSQRQGPLAAPPGVLKLLRASIDDYAAIKVGGSGARSANRDEQRRTLRGQAAALEITTDEGYRAAEEDYLDRREHLLALCDDDGWPA